MSKKTQHSHTHTHPHPHTPNTHTTHTHSHTLPTHTHIHHTHTHHTPHTHAHIPQAHTTHTHTIHHTHTQQNMTQRHSTPHLRPARQVTKDPRETITAENLKNPVPLVRTVRSFFPHLLTSDSDCEAEQAEAKLSARDHSIGGPRTSHLQN